MEALGLLMVGVGSIAAVVGSIWLVILAFQQSILWGLGCMLIPLVGLIFVIQHWDECKLPFGLNVLGMVVMVVGSMLFPANG